MNSSVKWIVSRVTLPLLLAVGVQARGSTDQVQLPVDYISVGDFSGTVNGRINAAIAAAMATDHKTVFFPNGTYALRGGLQLNQGANTELHLIGESREGVFLIPDIPHLEANFNGGDWQNGGARLAHMMNLDSVSVPDSVDVSIQNMTIDMRSPRVLGLPVTYNVVGHGIRVGKGWRSGQFTVNHVTIRNVPDYGIGIQDRGGHPKNNMILTNLLIERCGSDAIDTKEAGGDGNRNLVIRNLSVNEIGFLDTGAANAIDVRYRDTIIDNVNLVSRASRSTLPGQTSSNTGINFRAFEAGAAGILQATVSNAYLRGFSTGIIASSTNLTPHQNIAIRDFKIHGQRNTGLAFTGTNHIGHTVSNGYVDPDFGGAATSTGGNATVSNVIAGRWNPALSPVTVTTFEGGVSLSGQTYSPAWVGMVGTERVGMNPTAPGAGPFVFDVGNTGVMQIDYDGVHNAIDKLIVNGTLILGGQLRINTIGGAPTAPGTYRIFEADTITGSFDTITLPDVPGLIWVTDKLATNGTISLRQPPVSITWVNSGSRVVLGPLGNASTSFSFDAGANADMLMVAVSTERSFERVPTLSYAGHALTPAIERGTASIWFLDLTKTGYQGGSANLLIDFTGIMSVNGVALGVVSVNAAGRAIGLHATASGTASADLVTTRDDAFVLASFNANGSGSPSVDAPLTRIYASGNIGSAQGAAGYQANVAAGTHPINWTTGNKRQVAAAAFVITTTFADWIADYDLDGATALGDDLDGDSLPNGVEAWFGTHPGQFNSGLTNLTAGGTAMTFTHPQTPPPPSDLTGFYEWSPNLVDWYDVDGVDGPPGGATVTISSATIGTTTTVSATASAASDRVFLRAGVRRLEP
jgi:hypothetical protein